LIRSINSLCSIQFIIHHNVIIGVKHLHLLFALPIRFSPALAFQIFDQPSDDKVPVRWTAK